MAADVLCGENQRNRVGCRLRLSVIKDYNFQYRDIRRDTVVESI